MIGGLILLMAGALSLGQGTENKIYRGIYFAGPGKSALRLCGTDQTVWLTSYSQQANEFFVENKSYPLYLEVAGRLVELDRPKVTQSGRYKEQLFAKRVLDSAKVASESYEACRNGELEAVE